ncbi:MAG: NAD(+)--dinitrogen-reductase ADP-D-ribosyltransferase [Puniceicoccales bacterium]|jgi:NAD+--dinitrogen-reductase ADP-D-ribosyltransferase|nr:NAD(+)--dinitrogen-reductase ADP-D-ribosyltransferase [Puniceicoccales bacterium]
MSENRIPRLPATGGAAAGAGDDAVPPSLFSRCNVPPWRLASVEFQNDPQPLEIEGVRTADARLFALLDAAGDAAERGRIFHDYVSVKFRLHEWADYDGSARAALRHSYVQLLHAWSADSNSRAGAVLKGWVENRFGLRATFHNGRLTGGAPADTAAARERYWLDRMRGAERMLGVSMQLDLLFTFCQDELRRHFGDSERWVTLYRGTHDADEYELRGGGGGGTGGTGGGEGREGGNGAGGGGDGTGGGAPTVFFNNLSSFSSDSEVAWEFGSRVWEVRVPLAKVVFFSGLLPAHLLGGEAEWLVLGGEYHVKTLTF